MVHKWLLQTETSIFLWILMLMLMWLVWSLLLMIMMTTTRNYWNLESVHFAKRGSRLLKVMAWWFKLSTIFLVSVTDSHYFGLVFELLKTCGPIFGYEHPQILRHQSLSAFSSYLAVNRMDELLWVEGRDCSPGCPGTQQWEVAMLKDERLCWHEYCTGYLIDL